MRVKKKKKKKKKKPKKKKKKKKKKSPVVPKQMFISICKYFFRENIINSENMVSKR
jgi:ribosomal protein S25